ncbi:polyprenyl glycosylphosphotransferase [Nocardioides psychrotolerans]|uniref:Undecaprenyl-phosphate galactose phosphotransferase, WbaP/exopolysaccharide biosynthesis polyprenyl glycosylphosphotransferase n=1 Tax=Nocardioides psychrotolerans TaxID=1005945 RepID=A0A1I3N572_9ACTN|nr:sugar transferase [Nocardioides psychrotolerans]GEP40464.1 polyprenyl glycosylphosphotransferase [Nocardioides psychrotolerans]SFJ03986.1 Undecaprenyl-phosphate galactose phosphotransferase, WbaP/exopolysaccharide biosynthesis polyprenyl glycosylphosphotransferase [Nocardioides psychrotolerans]
MTIISERRPRLHLDAPSRALQYLPVTAFVLDAAVITGSAILAAMGREGLHIFETPADVSTSLWMVGPLIVLGWIASIALVGGYAKSVFDAGPDEYKRVVRASFIAAGLIGVGCFMAKYQLSRGFFLLIFTIGLPALVLSRFIVRRAVHAARRRGALLHRVVIAGSSGHIDEIVHVLRRESWLGYHVIGALTPAHEVASETGAGIPVLGNCDDATSVVLTTEADIVFFASGALTSSRQLRRIAWDLEGKDVQVVVAPSVSDVSGERLRMRPVGGLPLVHIDSPRATDAARWGKRLFDLAGSAALIAALSPVFVMAALSIKLHDRGPVMFRQSRVGKGGERFSCLKFRSMVTDAEAQLARLAADGGADSVLFKMREDPRVTRPGRWLRRLSIDELPQLLNVFRGEMSLVGPRPPLPSEVAKYDGDTGRRLHVRPGITGLWQVSGRSDLSWDETVRLDLYYVDNWSMLQDLSILAKTTGAVFRSRGAY